MQPYKIDWLSRHEPTEIQIRQLVDHFFGSSGLTEMDAASLLKIDVISQSFNNVKEIINVVKGYDDVVAVLPINLISDLTKSGIKPIRAVMRRNISCSDVTFEHDYFERIIEVKIVSERLT